MRAIIVLTQIIALLFVLQGGALLAWGYRGWGFVLVALGAGWSGILSATFFSLIAREARDEADAKAPYYPKKEDHE